MSDVRDVLILGAGPAGYTAALYAARANLRPLMITGWEPGGQLTITTDVENYPGFEHGVLGPDLMETMRKQVERFGTEMVSGAAARVDFTTRPFTVWTDEDKVYRAKTVIIATGATAKLIGIESETQLMGFGVSACATCDGPFFKNKRVIVVGGGDTAMEEANYLARLCSEVIIVHRRETLRASKIMQDRVRANPKIRFIWNSEVVEALGVEHQKLRGVKLRDMKTGVITEHEVDGLFIAIGHRPNTEFLQGALPLDELGYVQVVPGSAHTSIPGVFVAGDVADSVYRQAVTAAGTGCMAAIEAERWLEEQSYAERKSGASVSAG